MTEATEIMQRSVWAQLAFRRLPPRLVCNDSVLWRIIRAEGGQWTSLTLRDILAVRGVHVGEYSYGSLLLPGHAESGTHIGRYVSVGPGCRAFRHNHPVHAASLHPFWYMASLRDQIGGDDLTFRALGEAPPLMIEHDAWLGANVVVLPSATRIGIGAVVGAGSVVTRDVPDFAVAMGNPARVVRSRFPDRLVAELLQAQPWSLPPGAARAWYEAFEARHGLGHERPDSQDQEVVP